MLTSLFFVSAHKDSATRHGCALRSACRGVSERQWRSAAPVSAPASVGAGRSPLGSSTRGGSRDQVLLPLPQNRRKLWVSAGFLFACVVWFLGSLWFGFLVFSPVRTCCTPLQHPKRTRFCLFRAFPGAFSRFPLFWTCKISRPVFVYSAT